MKMIKTGLYLKNKQQTQDIARGLADTSARLEITELEYKIRYGDHDIEEYDIIFIGYPVWFHATPAPVNSFLESYDLTGKLIIPFCTSGGSGFGLHDDDRSAYFAGSGLFGWKRFGVVGW